MENIEKLEKSCPRCGKPSKNSGNKAGRCSACLKDLASNKKKPGHYLHNHKVADDAIRRQEGRNGTSPKKSSGHGSRKEIIDKVKREEKKHGQVVSLDRKDNKKGYTSSNVRGVDPKLNRGRHNVDSKKLKNWKQRLKKSNIDDDSFVTMMAARALEKGDEALADLIQVSSFENILKALSLKE